MHTYFNLHMQGDLVLYFPFLSCGPSTDFFWDFIFVDWCFRGYPRGFMTAEQPRQRQSQPLNFRSEGLYSMSSLGNSSLCQKSQSRGAMGTERMLQKTLANERSEVHHQARRDADERQIGEWKVWRPVEGPPLPRSRHIPSSTPLRVSTIPPTSTVLRHHRTADTALPKRPVSGNGPVLSSPPQQPALYPGQLLPRGKGGIDDILKNARETQNLFAELQRRRLKMGYRHTQQQLKCDLDLQREHQRMQQLCAYQEELVHIFGPKMRDIVADTFFDDGSDPVLEALRKKREAPRSPSIPPFDNGGSRTEASMPYFSTAKPQPTTTESCTSDITHNREIYNRALFDYRKGKRCPF